MLEKPTNNQSGFHNCDNYCYCIVQMTSNSTNIWSGSNTGYNKGIGGGLQPDSGGSCGKSGPWSDGGKVSENHDFDWIFLNWPVNEDMFNVSSRDKQNFFTVL